MTPLTPLPEIARALRCSSQTAKRRADRAGLTVYNLSHGLTPRYYMTPDDAERLAVAVTPKRSTTTREAEPTMDEVIKRLSR